VRAAKAYALTWGRKYVLPQDLKEIAHTVLAHRLALVDDYGSYDERAVLAAILAQVPVPKPHPNQGRAGGAAEQDGEAV
jgi:MoxR-like ATPase